MKGRRGEREGGQGEEGWDRARNRELKEGKIAQK